VIIQNLFSKMIRLAALCLSQPCFVDPTQSADPFLSRITMHCLYMHAERVIVFLILFVGPSVCLSDYCRYCVKTNGHIVRFFKILVGASF